MSRLIKYIYYASTMIFLSLFISAAAFAHSSQIENGIAYLSSIQSQTGSWGNTTGLTNNEYITTSEVLLSLDQLGITNTSAYQNGLLWIQGREDKNTAHLAKKIQILASSDVDETTDVNELSSFKNIDGGWGGYRYVSSGNFHSALALQALKAVNYSDQTIIINAINYLLTNQNLDGGFGFCSSASAGCSDSNSCAYMTALVSLTLQQLPQTTSIATALNKAMTYLITKQNPDGGFGQDPVTGQANSTTYETALALIVLINTGQAQDLPLQEAIQNGINFLEATQLTNGSWNDDPYSTALALRALSMVKPNLTISSSDMTLSNPTPTVGDTITITTNVHNTGPTQAPSTDSGQAGISVQFYDGDPIPNPQSGTGQAGGTLIGETTISSIPAYGNALASINYTLTTASAKTIYVSLDQLNTIDELNETDNTAFKNLTSATLPDLSITSADVEIFPPAPDPYIMVGIYIKVRNRGEMDASNVLVNVYLGDPLNGGINLPGGGVVPNIPAGGVINITTAMAAEQVTSGLKTIYVLVDPNNSINESNEANNQAVKTFYASEGYVDLAVAKTDISFNPVNLREGEVVTITATIRNLGYLVVANNVVARFYLGDPASGGVKIGSDIIAPSLGTATVSTTWNTTGHTGNNDIYAVVDPDNVIAEPTKFNNNAFKTLQVAASQGPDLTITSADINFSPLTPNTGNIVTITAKVRNVGTTDVTNVPVEFSLGDPNVEGTVIIADKTIPFIAKGGSATAQLVWNTAGFAGIYEVYANADPFNEISEMNEQNNISHATLEITAPQGPDITVTSIATTNLLTDIQTRQVSGTIKITVENKGNQPAGAVFEIVAFEDRNKNKKFDVDTDKILGSYNYTGALTAGAIGNIDLSVSGNILFRDNLIYVMVDSGNSIQELNETNNMLNTGQECEYIPAAGTFNPVEKWSWTGSSVLPTYNQVISTPMVARIIDTNGDGIINEQDVPAIIFHTFYSGPLYGDGVLRAVRGDNGQEIFTVTDPAYRTNPFGAIAVGDIDNDGLPEIIAPRSMAGIIVFEHDGTYKWQTTNTEVRYGGPSIADIDEDGNPEILVGNVAFNSNGTVKWWGSGGVGFNAEGAFSLAADIDMTGNSEVVAGNTVYRSDGTILWRNTSVGDGFNAVANFDGDPYPEIVLVSSGRVYLLEHTGQIKWGPIYIPGGGRGGAPIAADFDGDGKIEIGVAGSSRYVVYRSDGSILWQSIISDYSSSMTGSSVFDFDGDGKAEVVYNDEQYLRIYRGTDGAVLFSTLNSTWTTAEYPVIADIDNDNRAEIVVCANTPGPYKSHNGIRVFEDKNDTWVNTRKIWNQHAYNITNVNDDGTIPRIEQNNWEIYNNYRCNSLLPEEVLGTADITASYITIDQTNYPTTVKVSARIGNGGAVSQVGGIDIAFYNGDPAQGGVFIGTPKTTKILDAGDYEDVSVTWNNPSDGNHIIYIIADKTNKFNECRENNNVASALFNIGISQPLIEYNPDLEITPSDLTIIPPVIEGQSAKITAVIHNSGNLGASDVVVSFYDGDPKGSGTLIGSQTKSFIDAGATALAEITWNTFGQSGTNYIHAVVDPQNLITESNENNNATLMPIDVATPSKPDLVITSSDISFSNLNPQEGQPLVITATVHNFGIDTSDVKMDLYDGSPSSGTIIGTYTLAQIIQFGGQTQISFSVDTVGLSGNHEFQLLLDPDNTIDETNETNNSAWNSLTIGPSGLSLGVSADKTSYNTNEDVLITVNTGNLTGSDRTGTIEVRITDLSSNVVSTVASQPVSLGSGSSGSNCLSSSNGLSCSYTWNTGGTLSGDYKVYAVYVENGNVTAKADTAISISKDMNMASKVTTDKVSYYPNQPVTITSKITSLSLNYIFENLTATIVISDQLSAVSLHSETQTIPILMPEQLVELKTYWNSATYPSGDYPVTLTLTDASGAVLSASTTTLTISSEVKPSKLLKGTIAVDRQSLLQGEPIDISYSVTNTGNMDLSPVNLSVKTVHTVQLSVYDTLTDQADLLKGESYSNNRQLNTQTYSAKDYLVVLRASISGVEETLASTYFRVEGAPSAPSLHLPMHGEDVESLTPILMVNNAADPNDDKLTYEFELYMDGGLSNPIASSGATGEGTNTTSWQVLADLQENATYYWRARAYDGRLYGQWMSPAAFRVNAVNDSPTVSGISFPAESSYVDTTTPVLTVNNATDPDSYNLTYNFVVAHDPDLINIVASQIGIFEGQGTTSWRAPMPLQENKWYYWSSQADDWLITGPWMATAKFFVNTTNEAPSSPVIVTPADGLEIAAANVSITALNSTDPDSSGITYVFEVDSSLTFDTPDKITSEGLPEGTGTTSWLAYGLRDNTWYYARVKASDGLAESPWSTVVQFFVNTSNDAPTAPVLENPSTGAGVNAFNPLLTVYNSADPDGDVLTYEFEVYVDASLTNLVSAASNIQEAHQMTAWTVTTSLTENTTYYWRARAFDSQLYSPWMPTASFMVNTANDAPGAPMLYAPAMGSSLSLLTPTLSVLNATDPDSDTLTYDFELYAQGVLITPVTGVQQGISGITSTALNALSDNTTYNWRARAYDGDRYGAWMDMAAFSIHMPRTSINSTIDFDPNTLNQKNKGNWVTVYIELSSGYNVADIAVSSVRLEGTIPAETWPYSISDYDKDGIPDLMVKFNRDAVINLLPDGDMVTVKMTGTVGAITFEGVDMIRVIH